MLLGLVKGASGMFEKIEVNDLWSVDEFMSKILLSPWVKEDLLNSRKIVTGASKMEGGRGLARSGCQRRRTKSEEIWVP